MWAKECVTMAIIDPKLQCEVVFRCVLLSEREEGTLFASSAPSRPDVCLLLKELGSGLQLSFPHCI